MVIQCDLSSLASIRAFAAKVLEQEQSIDIVVLNAAIRGCPMVRLPTRHDEDNEITVRYRIKCRG